MKIVFERSISDQDIANIKTPQELSDFLLVIEQAAGQQKSEEHLRECALLLISIARQALSLPPPTPRRGRPPKNRANSSNAAVATPIAATCGSEQVTMTTNATV